MEIDGGGWTLVATIHDNNPFETGRCTLGDKWSSERGASTRFPKGDKNWVNTNTFGQVKLATFDDFKNPAYFDKWSSERGASTRFPKGDKNWENTNTFGQVKLATFDDFKNPAYFELQSKDIMMWQVPNGTPLRNFSRQAYLKYRTNSEFLTQYGGNLQRLYSEHFPIKSKTYLFPGDRGPSVPVVFEKGSADSLRQHLPPSFVSNGLEIGYIQVQADCRKNICLIL